MNNNLKIKYLVLILFLSSGVQAQFYKKGRIVTQNNDTVYGLIKDVGGIWNANYCQFKESKKSQAVKYYPNQIISYGFIDDKYYSSQRLFVDTGYRDYFFDVLLEGDVNLYYFRKYRNMSYFLQKKGGTLVGLSNEHITISHPVTNRVIYDVGYKLEIHDYKDTLSSLFKDCPEIQKQIRDFEYNRKSIVKITKEYIDLTCKKNNCIRYERDKHISKPTVGIFSGVRISKVYFLDPVYSTELETENTPSFPMGVFYNIPFDFFIEGLSFQMEFIYNQLTYHPKFTRISNDLAYVNFSSEVYSIPLLFNYGYKMKKLYPTVGFGKEFGLVTRSKFQYLRYGSVPVINSIYGGVDCLIHKQQNGGWFFDLAVTYKIHPKFSLFTGIRFQRQYNLIINDEYANNYSFAIAEKDRMGKKYETDMTSIRIGISF